MTDIDTLIAELRAGLEGTTPGEWRAGVYDGDLVMATSPEAGDADIVCEAPTESFPLSRAQWRVNARHIALASPQNIRALLDHIERLEVSPRADVLIAERNAAEARAEAAEAADAVREKTHVWVPRDDVIGVVASLAATISVIERTPQARKAAMSDKAFGIMLDDYTKALAKGRAMLSASGDTHD